MGGIMNNDINCKYEDIVRNCVKRLVPLKLRFKIIVYLNNQYFSEVKESLPTRFLNTLAGWCVKEIYADKTANKVAVTEYPFLSMHQYKRRIDRQVNISQMETLEALAFHKSNNSLKYNNKGAVADA